MLYMSSQSTNTGSLTITVTFALGTDLNIAQVQVENRVAIATPQLPSQVQELGITVRQASPDITLAIALYSPDSSRDTLFMSNYALLQLENQLLRLPGVGSITIFGERDYSMRIWLDPNKMAARSLMPGDVITAVQNQNLEVAAGTIGGPPISGKPPFQFTVNAMGQLSQPSQFAKIVVKTSPTGAVTYLGDLGTVTMGAYDYSTTLLYNGHPAVGVAIFQLPGTNAIATANVVYTAMQQFSKKFPPGMSYSIAHDTTIFVRAAIQDVFRTLLLAILLVALVVLVFLQTWRASLVPILAIPVSLIGAFAVMWMVGFSLNMLSLFGLVLSIGIVVDDAIVVVENIQRWVDEGISPRDAAFRAMDEVTPAVIAIAFGLSAVFVPVAFIPGITGEFYRQFALVIAFSTLLSAFNSLSLSPALCALLLKGPQQKKDWLTRGMDFTLGWFFKLFNRTLTATTRGYQKLLRRVVRLTVLVLIVYGGLVFLAYYVFQQVPTGFIPNQDQGYLIVNVQAPDGSSIERTVGIMQQYSQLVLQTKGVKDCFAVAGFSIISGASASDAGLIFLHLTPFAERTTPDLSADAIAAALRKKFATVQGGMAVVLSPSPVHGIGTAGGFMMMIEDRSGTATPQELAKYVGQVIAAGRKRPEIMGLFTSFTANVPQLYADVDRVKAEKARVGVPDIYTTLGTYLGGTYVNNFNYLGRTWNVMAQADAQYRQNMTQVQAFEVRNAAGSMVPLGSVMNMTNIAGPDRIQRYDLYMAADIDGMASPGYSSGQALAAMEQVADKTLPPTYGYEWTTMAFQEITAGEFAFLVFPLCVLFVWLTHSAEYESFALSTSIILIVPMCLLCGIVAIMVRHMTDNIFTQIGFVVLAGMSVKNAVLIVEFAKQQQEHHPDMKASDAAIEASHLRLRPILMTSFAFIFGVIPLITASGAGAEMRQELGTVVFFGMIGVTFFGIFLTPVFFTTIRYFLPAKHRAAGPALPDPTRAFCGENGGEPPGGVQRPAHEQSPAR
ncbi:MAG TPA: efflux RND transporter permease subunit [Tepidisphaeraceae bacterium]|nr:efflux RND transporter permease subunit [Tepidisphaeraceae bacterium]